MWCWWDRGRNGIKGKGRLSPGAQAGRLVGINFRSTCICGCGGQYRAASGSHESPTGRRLGFKRSNWFLFTSSVGCLHRLNSVTYYSRPWPTINLGMRLFLKTVRLKIQYGCVDMMKVVIALLLNELFQFGTWRGYKKFTWSVSHFVVIV